MGEWTVVGLTLGMWEIGCPGRLGQDSCWKLSPMTQMTQGPCQTPKFSSLPMEILIQRLWEGPGNLYF